MLQCLKAFVLSRWPFVSYVYFRGWRRLFLVWGLPWGAGGCYDLLQGQEYVPETWPVLSNIIPTWLIWSWLAIGVVLFVAVTIEGAYRYTQRVEVEANAKLTRVESERDTALSHAGDGQRQQRIGTELEKRQGICKPIQDILPKLRDRVTWLVANTDTSALDEEPLKKASERATQYAESHSDESQDELLREIRHALDTYAIGIEQLIQADEKARGLSKDLESRCGELSQPVLNERIHSYKRVLYNNRSAQLLAKYATGDQLLRVANFMRVTEDTNERLTRIMVEINLLIETYIRGDDIQ